MEFVKKNLLYIVLGILVVGGGYYFFFVQGKSDTSTITTVAGPASSAEATFINLSAQLQPITFDTKILSDSRFTSLQDIHTSIVPETAGRRDPFAPLTGVAVAAK